MKKITLLLIIGSFVFAQEMIVRVYVSSWQDLNRISDGPLEIAAGRYGEWYDLVVERDGLNKVIASGLPYEVTIYSLAYEKEKYRGSYLSYTQINDSLRHLALNYPNLCKFDSLPIRTYEGRWIYGIKISDNVNLNEFEPNFSLDGCHHSREWATPQAVLFFTDSMLRSYSVVPEIAEIINTTQIYCFPLINVDGYVYDYPGQLSWRKNREPFGGSIGTDCNRNYNGACNGEIDGYWGAADEGQVSHTPSLQDFCGAYSFSGDEVRAYANYIRNHNIVTGFSLHSYGEQVMWPWGYKGTGTPDSALYRTKGNYMAGLMQRIGGGTYTPGQSYSNPYPTCGNLRDWVYGYNHWVNGLSSLFYGSEIGTTFYQPVGDLDFISRQVFKAAKYLAGFSDSLVILRDGMVAPPTIYPIGNVSANFTVVWHPRNAYDNNPIRWELVELSNPSITTDSLESGTGRWTLQGFTLSTAQSHSPTHSFFSGNTINMNNAVQTLHPYLVQSGDSLTFWCYYNLQNNYDVAVVEVSEDTKEWFNLDTTRFTGTQNSWVRRAYPLTNWIGKSVYIRFRCMYDGTTTSGGFYVDDIKPICLFGTVNTISNNITDTLYQFIGHPQGTYYYYVRGNNTAWGWGDYSCLQKANVLVGVAENNFGDNVAPILKIYPSVFKNRLDIRYQIGNSGLQLKIYDASGRLIRQWDYESIRLSDKIIWHGDDDFGNKLPAGIYFVQFVVEPVGDMGGYKETEKVIFLR